MIVDSLALSLEEVAMSRFLVLALLLLIALTGYVSAAQPLSGDKPPETDGKAIIAFLQESGYQGWQLWPGKPKFYPGRFPHGSLLTTYVSKGAYRAVRGKAGSIPTGEFVVKENYTPDKQLIAITVMYKQAGYNAEGGDWFWLKALPDGTIQEEGKVGGCIGCHAAVKNNDWLFIGPVK
jgi:hypothetical protein